MEETTNGIKYTWHLAGPNGANFILFTEADTPTVEIKKAKRELKYQRDAVRITIATEQDRINEFRSAFFRLAKHLPWYHIYDDWNTIKKELRKGTTPEEYYKKFVLPNVSRLQKEVKQDPLKTKNQ